MHIIVIVLVACFAWFYFFGSSPSAPSSNQTVVQTAENSPPDTIPTNVLSDGSSDGITDEQLRAALSLFSAEDQAMVNYYIEHDRWPTLEEPDLDLGKMGTLAHGFVMHQVLKEDAGLVRLNGTLVMLNHIDTSNMVDGGSYKSEDVFIVKGTIRYETAVGSSRQVFLVEMYPLSSLMLLKRVAEATKAGPGSEDSI